MSQKLLQTIEQLKTAAPEVSIRSYVSDGEKFRALVELTGAKPTTEWTHRVDGELCISERLDHVVDGVRVVVLHLRAPTLDDWRDKLRAVEGAAS